MFKYFTFYIGYFFVFNLTYKTYQIEQNTKSAIVIKSTILKEQAHLLSNNVVQFPKGLKVYICERRGDWQKVLLPMELRLDRKIEY
ncbi:MAG: hypothetical protein IPF63_14970 [Bacteroidetes bacterium]|nr:hypothetical protein [Bacteroidota bacterium]